ncbi:MAG: HAMP domain-containing histidine kinase [Propionibacteriaceae bacterium]|jgi:two-component system OmpR family sensor kinase|nr:HAMP domain-containing histidine kinase [Propionibacteriaceae bacterium]
MANPFLPPKPDAVAPMSPGTLSRRLVLRVTAFVAALTILLSSTMLLATFQILTDELDSRLQSATVRRGRGGITSASDTEGSGMIGFERVGGQQWSFSYYPPEMDESQRMRIVAAMDGMELGTSPVTVAIPGVGPYRVLAKGFVIVGLPYSNVSEPMQRQVFFAIAFTMAAILLAFFGTRTVVSRSLRPLNRLADTAAKVTRLPLAAGEVTVPVRATDIDPRNEVGQVGNALNSMLDHVENALAARQRSETKVRQFVADASHELRNPLAAIRGYAELTRRDRDELPPDVARALDRIEGESDRMSAMVEDMLLLARLDSRPDDLDLQPTDVTEVVLNAVSDAQVAGPDHKWTMELPEGELIAPADKHRLHQVVANLLANARTHTPAGTWVHTRLHAAKGQVIIEVIDNGPGVPKEIRDSVFERFSRADSARARKSGISSTGLGLAIVAAVVSAHHGTVELDCGDGFTRFVIRIPAGG